jgi:ATP-binding cassette subfamily B multidrug efflux pump
MTLPFGRPAPRIPRPGPALRALLALLATRRRQYLLGMLALAVSDGGQLAIARLVGMTVDALRAGRLDAGGLHRRALAIVGIALTIMGARYAWRQLIFGSSRAIERDLRQRLHDHLQRLDARFYLDNKVGALMAYATNDVPAVQVAAASGMMAALDAILVFGGAALMMAFTVSWQLALVVLLPLCLLSPLSYLLGRRLHKRYGEVQASFSRLSERVQENVSGVRVVRGYAAEAREAARFGAANEDYRRRFSEMLRYDVAFDPLIGLLAGVSFSLGLGLGGWMVVDGRISLGAYISFNTYLAMLVWPMLALGWVVNLFQRATASMERLEAVLRTAPAVTDRPQARPLPRERLRGQVTLRDLRFRYSGELPWAVDGISVDLSPGRTLGILGRTGSGKSSIAGLLLRVFDPEPGQVFLDGHDVLDLRLADLRAAIAYVPQDAFLFSRTIAENIAFDPRPEAYSREEIAAAARLADLAADVEAFPAGYDTLVGERGVTLSGGQRQRVCLARALIRQARVLILDDALSAVDTATESRILAALRPYLAERTAIIIASRVSAVREAEEILVLDEGRVVERGDHAGLLAAGGAYRRLYERQQLEEALAILA